MKKFKTYLTPEEKKLSFAEQALLQAKKKIQESIELEKQKKIQAEEELKKNIVYKIKDERTIVEEYIGETPEIETPVETVQEDVPTPAPQIITEQVQIPGPERW